VAITAKDAPCARRRDIDAKKALEANDGNMEEATSGCACRARLGRQARGPRGQ
jgi:hypothetical protein